MNKSRTILAFTLALLTSGLLTWFIGRTINNRAIVATTPQSFSHIVVTTKDVSAGEVLAAGSLSIIDWASPQALVGSLTDPAIAIGRVAAVSFVSGEPVLLRQLTDLGLGQGISGTIPRGMRAVTVRGPEVAAISNFLEPGDLVDVLASSTSGAAGPSSCTVLQAARVFAVGDRTTPSREHELNNTSSLTLLVAFSDVGKLNLAMAGGRIIFAARNAMDTTKDSVSIDDVAPRQKLAQTRNPGKLDQHNTKTMVASSRAFTVETVAGGKLISQSFEGALP